jgi:archaellum component FlaF (FlaF/FlaG flagellin family)
MYKLYIKSKRGSSLVLVMLALAILSMLGIALLSLSILHYRTNLADRNSKTAFYLSEAGLDQAYQKLCVQVKAAMDDAQGKIDKEIDSYIAKERLKEMGDKEDPPIDSSLIQNNREGSINPNGEVDQAELYKLLNGWFKKYYKEYLDRTDSSGELVLVEKLDSVRYNAEYKAFEKAEGYGIPKVVVENKNVTADGIDMTLLSEYLQEGIAKQTRVTYTITVPNYQQPYSLETELKYDLAKNALYSKALTAQKNIILEGGKVDITGDVYAGGMGGERVSETGILMKSGGTLNIEGRVVTGGYITAGGSSANINLKGDVYCNTLYIPEGAAGSSIKVGEATAAGDSSPGYKKKNVYTLEDLRMDGLRANISVYGNYYGFSKGDTTNLNRSSIIINSDDFGISNGSSMKITGEQPAVNMKFPGNESKPAGSVIAGSSFIGLENAAHSPVLYQTGESVSVKGNYAAYTMGLEKGSIPKEEDKNKFDKEHIAFEDLYPLRIAVGFDTDGDGAVNQYFSGESGGEPAQSYRIEGIDYLIYKGLDDKAKYFTYAYHQDKDVIKFGDDVSLDIRNVKYSTGIFIDRNQGNTPLQKYINPQVILALPKLQREYEYYVNTMGDPQMTNYLNPGNYGASVRVEDLFRFGTDIFDKGTDGELYYTNSNGSKAMVLRGPGTDSAVGTPAVGSYDEYSLPSDGVVKGIIVTRGDVYLTGTIHFTGTIITTGSIYMMDNNHKKITNDYDELRYTDLNNFIMKKVSKDKNTPGTQLGDLFRNKGEASQKVYVTVSKVDTITDGSYINFEEIIRSKSWQRVK